jgi:hypothetical protein
MHGLDVEDWSLANALHMLAVMLCIANWTMRLFADTPPVCSHIAERMLTYGDVGTPVCELSEEFPPLSGCFSDVKQEGPWWHGGSKNCKRKGVFGEKETTAQFKVRCLTWSRMCGCAGGLQDGLHDSACLTDLEPTACFTVVHIYMTRWQSMQERIAAAKRWLDRQPESVIFLYGHSVFWRAFFAHSDTLRNCEYRLLHW